MKAIGVVLLSMWAGACAASSAAETKTAEPSPSVAPCAPEDCAPCDETKQKCMGPGVCGGHPEKAKRVCARDASGACRSQLVCE